MPSGSKRSRFRHRGSRFSGKVLLGVGMAMMTTLVFFSSGKHIVLDASHAETTGDTFAPVVRMGGSLVRGSALDGQEKSHAESENISLRLALKGQKLTEKGGN